MLINLNNIKSLYIYGAQIYAETVYSCLKSCYSEIVVEGFLVTNTEGNQNHLDGLPVYGIKDLPDDKKNVIILIATSVFYHNEIINLLKSLGFNNYEVIDSDLQYNLAVDYFFKAYRSCGEEFYVLPNSNHSECSSDVKLLKVYAAQSNVDKLLLNSAKTHEWLVPVHAGAALSSDVLPISNDMSGKNISSRNRNFCELTVAYWLWKNKGNSADFIGLCHYRRYLDIKSISLLENEHIDAILPVPVLVFPNADFHHRRFIRDIDWTYTMNALKKLYPDYYIAAKRIFKEKTFYLHNIWILRQKHLNGFMKWLFTILFEVEEMRALEGYRLNDRYLGYIGENLTTLYFLYNKNHMKIYHCKETVLF